ncbi:MAG TPA: CDP-alcohol phosphatidyltransferase family protein [Acidimicrobiales bacterium]|nr:CDP-alcohol phosphatidyltransferase family protein [Acidimicrobiales bacterium]
MEEHGSSAILTVPNVISLVRLLCVPLFVYLLFGRHERAYAAYLLAALGATDWVDGYIARHFGQVSELGKVLDPTADRAVLIVGIGCIAIDHAAPYWLIGLAVFREVAIAIAALAIAAAGARRMDVRWFGKAGTFGLLVAFPLFLGVRAHVSWEDQARLCAWIAAIPGLIFGYIAAVLYIPDARRAIQEGRAARDAQEVSA